MPSILYCSIDLLLGGDISDSIKIQMVLVVSSLTHFGEAQILIWGKVIIHPQAYLVSISVLGPDLLTLLSKISILPPTKVKCMWRIFLH